MLQYRIKFPWLLVPCYPIQIRKHSGPAGWESSQEVASPILSLSPDSRPPCPVVKVLQGQRNPTPLVPIRAHSSSVKRSETSILNQSNNTMFQSINSCLQSAPLQSAVCFLRLPSAGVACGGHSGFVTTGNQRCGVSLAL